MKRLLLLFILTLSAAMAISADNIYVVSSSRKLNVRAEPSRSAAIICQLNPRQEVRGISDDGNWTLVQLDNGRRGYASSDYLSYRRPYRAPASAAHASSSGSSSGGFWSTTSGHIIILIIVSLIGIGIINFIDSDSFIMKLLAAIGGGCFTGGILGLLSWWIFDNFWTPFLLCMAVWIVMFIVAMIRNYTEDRTGYDEPFTDWDRSSGGSYSRPSSSYSYNSYNSNTSYDDDDDDDDSYSSRQKEDGNDRRRKQEENYRYFQNHANDYYRSYEDYRRRAQDALSQAETEERYADSYESRGRMLDDYDNLRRAQECRDRASSYRRKADSYASEADRYYNLYREALDNARN